MHGATIKTRRLICLLHLGLAGGAHPSFLRTKILYAASYQIIKWNKRKTGDGIRSNSKFVCWAILKLVNSV